MIFLLILAQISIISSLIYLFFRLLQNMFRLFSAKWQYNVLKLLLVFFTVPCLCIVIYSFVEQAGIQIEYAPNNDEFKTFIFMTNYFSNIMYINHNKFVPMLFLLWLIGFTVIFKRKIKRIKQQKEFLLQNNIEDKYLSDLVSRLKSEEGIKATINVKVNSNVTSPCLVLGKKATIIMPFIFECEQDNLAVLRHELIHYKRNDSFYKACASLFCAIYWFNPISYRMAESMDQYCEMACDEEVISQFSRKQKDDYIDCILRVLQYAIDRKSFSSNIPFVNINERKLKMRLLHMRKYKKTVKKSVVALVVSLVFAVGVPVSTKAMGDGLHSFTNKLLPEEFADLPTGQNSYEEIGSIVDTEDVDDSEIIQMTLMIMPRGSTDISYEIEPQKSISTKAVQLKKGDIVNLMIIGSPGTVSFTVTFSGITMKSDNGMLSKKYTIPSDGFYAVKIKNNSASDVLSVTGRITIN